MGLSAPDRDTLRTKMQEWLYKIPEVVSSKDPLYKSLTGLSQADLEANWAKGGILTGCNSFLGVVAKAFGVPGTSVLARGFLDISQAEKEVPGCWQEANSAEACLNDITPRGGDFYSTWYKGKINGKDFFQKWGHVGIVYDCDPDTGDWWLVEGGQGGPRAGADFIKWKCAKFDRTKLNGWIDMARYLMPQDS